MISANGYAIRIEVDGEYVAIVEDEPGTPSEIPLDLDVMDEFIAALTSARDLARGAK